MGLFINSTLHPDVYQNNGRISEPNQTYFETDYTRELIQEQKRFNEGLTEDIKKMNHRQTNAELNYVNKWRDVTSQLDLLQKRQIQQEKFEHDTKEWLIMLENSNNRLQEILQKDMKEDIIDGIQRIGQSNEEIASRLTQYEQLSNQLTKQMDYLVELHQGLSDQMDKQDEKQDHVLTSYEEQEALMEKTLRQVEHLRSILYERTSFLTDKIESSYNLTSSLIYKLISGSDKPLTLLMSNRKED